MSTFVFTYRLPKTYTGGSPEVMALWNGWFESMGANLVDRGNPVFTRTTLGNCESEGQLAGYSLVIAHDLEAAATLAKGCPALQQGGGVEVGELTLLNDGRVQAARS
jgi:hypothetical protein